MLSWFKKLFTCEKLLPGASVEIEVISDQAAPIVRITVGDQSLLLTSAQARKLWGKLGANLEKMTPDK